MQENMSIIFIGLQIPIALVYFRKCQSPERGHSTAAEAARVALDAGAKQLLTGHYSSRYKNDSLFLEEAKTIFHNVILGNEGLRIAL